MYKAFLKRAALALATPNLMLALLIYLLIRMDDWLGASIMTVLWTTGMLAIFIGIVSKVGESRSRQ